MKNDKFNEYLEHAMEEFKYKREIADLSPQHYSDFYLYLNSKLLFENNQLLEASKQK